jgi:GTP-binding protein
VPNLGIVKLNDTSFMVADIPGLIEGASSGKGLGFQFLRHVERTRLLVHLLDGTRENPKDDFLKINKELATYDKDLAARPQIIVINKTELLTDKQKEKLQKTKFTTRIHKSLPVFFISAVTNEGVRELVGEIAQTLQKIPVHHEDLVAKVFTYADLDTTRFEVSKKGRRFVVTGSKQERLLTKTDLENPQAVGRMLKVLNRMGVLAELKKIGARPGDIVQIGSKEFEFDEV